LNNHILKTVIIAYALLMTFCNNSDKQYTEPSNAGVRIKTELAQKYKAVLLDDILDINSYKSHFNLLTHTAIMDTVILSAVRQNNKYYLNARILNKDDGDICARFTCSNEIYELYNSSGTTSFIVAAKINRIDSLCTVTELKSIEDETLLYNSNNRIYLAGTCIDLVEDPRAKEIITHNIN